MSEHRSLCLQACQNDGFLTDFACACGEMIKSSSNLLWFTETFMSHQSSTGLLGATLCFTLEFLSSSLFIFTVPLEPAMLKSSSTPWNCFEHPWFQIWCWVYAIPAPIGSPAKNSKLTFNPRSGNFLFVTRNIVDDSSRPGFRSRI